MIYFYITTLTGCASNRLTIIYKGVILKDKMACLSSITGAIPNTTILLMYLLRAATAVDLPAVPVMPLLTLPPLATPVANDTAPLLVSMLPAATLLGKRVVLLVRHGQCCHEGESDELKALTTHGHLQAAETAKFLKNQFDSLKLPNQRALLQSTSRRARETAIKIIEQVRCCICSH